MLELPQTSQCSTQLSSARLHRSRPISWGCIHLFRLLPTVRTFRISIFSLQVSRWLFSVQTGTPLAGGSFLWRGSSGWSVWWYAVPPFGPRIALILYAGVLAYVIGKMDGIGGKRGWQW